MHLVQGGNNFDLVFPISLFPGSIAQTGKEHVLVYLSTSMDKLPMAIICGHSDGTCRMGSRAVLRA